MAVRQQPGADAECVQLRGQRGLVIEPRSVSPLQRLPAQRLDQIKGAMTKGNAATGTVSPTWRRCRRASSDPWVVNSSLLTGQRLRQGSAGLTDKVTVHPASTARPQ